SFRAPLPWVFQSGGLSKLVACLERKDPTNSGPTRLHARGIKSCSRLSISCRSASNAKGPSETDDDVSPIPGITRVDIYGATDPRKFSMKNKFLTQEMRGEDQGLA